MRRSIDQRLFALGLFGGLVLRGQWAYGEIGPQPPQLDTTMPQTPEQTAALAGLGLALGLAFTIEAMAGVMSTAAVAESTAIGIGIGQSLAVGGVAGTVAAISLTTVAVATVAISILGLVIAVIGAAAIANALRQNHPVQAAHTENVEGGGLTAPPADTEGNPVGQIIGIVGVTPSGGLGSFRWSGSGRGLDPDTLAELNNCCGMSISPPGFFTELTITEAVPSITNPATGLPSVSPGGLPSIGTDIDADADAPAPDVGGLSVGEGDFGLVDGHCIRYTDGSECPHDYNGSGHGYGHHYVHHTADVPWTSTLYLFLTVGLGFGGRWVLRRCSA